MLCQDSKRHKNVSFFKARKAKTQERPCERVYPKTTFLAMMETVRQEVKRETMAPLSGRSSHFTFWEAVGKCKFVLHKNARIYFKNVCVNRRSFLFCV